MIDRLNGRNLILASQSPRRKMLFEALGFPFEVRKIDVDEHFDPSLKAGEIPTFLAKKKASAIKSQLAPSDLLVTADTVVWINDHALNKPADHNEAKAMLEELSGATHSVFTGVCITTTRQQHSFYEETKVHFNVLSTEAIAHYLARYQPYDKAGAYGIQEFIGLIGIQAVEGDFYNVVGFPMQRFWRELSVVFDHK